MQQESLGKRRYSLIFKDEFSGFRQIYFIREKSEVFEKLKLFCNEVKNQFGKHVKEIHSDGGKEFNNEKVASFLRNNGIKHSMSVVYTPQQNGVAERDNRTIVEVARSMIYSRSDIPLFLWAEAMNTAVYVINRTGPTKYPDKTPYELWYGKFANIDNLKVFGTECFAHVPKERRRKLDKKAIPGLLVGYVENCKGYRIYVPSLNDVILSRDILFKKERLAPNNAILKASDLSIDNQSYPDAKEDEHLLENILDDDLKKDNPLQRPNVTEEPNVRQLRDRSKIKRPDFYGYPATYLTETLPTNYSEAVNSKNKDAWISAMQDEFNSLLENKTWVLVEKPENKRVISNRWVFAKKLNHDGTERYKARLVIRGCLQIEGIDYNETFSPVVRFETIRIILSIAAHDGLCLRQFDIKTAFLYGSLNEEIFMKQPEGFNDGTFRVCKLLKSLYGLKQAQRSWAEVFNNFLKNFGFKQSTADPCMFIYKEKNEKIPV